MSNEKKIQDAQRVRSFLKDDAVELRLALMERRYFEEFKKADTSEARVRAWAKANLLDDFLNEMKIVGEQGDYAAIEAQRASARTPNRKE